MMRYFELKDKVNEISELMYNSGYENGRSDALKWNKNFAEYTGDCKIQYHRGINDAWELVRKVFHMLPNERESCFGCLDLNTSKGIGIITHNTYDEVVSKITAYEELKDSIKVGSEVIYYGEPYIITKRSNDGSGDTLWLLNATGGSLLRVSPDSVKPTGRYFEQVVEMLEALNESVEESDTDSN